MSWDEASAMLEMRDCSKRLEVRCRGKSARARSVREHKGQDGI